MHEVVLMKDMVSVLEKELDTPEVGQVKKVYLEIGALRYVIPDIMIECFDQIPKSDKLNGAEIDIKIVPVKVNCSDCGTVSEVSDAEYLCSSCSGDNVEFISGDEFKIKGIEW